MPRSRSTTRPTPIDKLVAMGAMACIRGLTPAALRVGLRILHHFNCQTGRCYPGIELLAAATGLSTRTVFRAKEELETRGLVHIKHRRGRRNTNIYSPDFERIKSFNLTSLSDLPKNDARRPGNLTSSARKPDNSSPNNLTATSREHMKENMKEHDRDPMPKSLSNALARRTNLAAKGHLCVDDLDAGRIDWASWARWLGTEGISEGTRWISQAIDRIEADLGLTHDQACLLVDKCLRKARATWPLDGTLDELLELRIDQERQRRTE